MNNIKLIKRVNYIARPLDLGYITTAILEMSLSFLEMGTHEIYNATNSSYFI